MRVITTGLCVASDQRLPCEPTGALPQTPPHPHLLGAIGHGFFSGFPRDSRMLSSSLSDFSPTILPGV